MLDGLGLAGDELRRPAMPAQLIAGAQDALQAPSSAAARLERLLPCFTAVVVPDMGHALVGTTGHVIPFLLEKTGPAG